MGWGTLIILIIVGN